VPSDDPEIERPRRGIRRGNLILLVVLILVCSLLFVPAIKIVLEEPSKRPLALVVGFAILAFVIVLITLPKRHLEVDHLDSSYFEDSLGQYETEGKKINEVAILVELRSVALRRLQLRRCKDDKEMRLVMRSPEDLMVLLGDDQIVELILEDPRYLAWKMGQEDFLDTYERLLARVEAWK